MLRIGEQAHKTDTGRQRSANEDAYFARAPIFAVADGMGGAQAGEVASRLATEAFESRLEGERPPEEELRRIVQDANRRIHELAKRDASRTGMGTTLTAALLGEREVSLAHAGDSRAYVFRDGELKRLTQDHSLVEELRRQGRLTDSQAAAHPQRSVITRALGPEPEVEVDTMTIPARDGDLFLLCSDGLTTMVAEGRISEILAAGGPLDGVVRTLVGEANEAGGRDNITVVLFRLEELATGGEEAESKAEAEETLAGRTATEAGLTKAAVEKPQEEPQSPAATFIQRPGDRTRGREAGPAAEGPRTRGRKLAKRAFKLAAAMALAAAATTGAIYGARQIYFLGADEQGRLALYRGPPYELPAGLKLYDRRYSTAVPARSLPPERRRRMLDHRLRSRADALDIVRRLERQRGILR